MSAEQLPANESEEVTCVLVPLDEQSLLVPNVCVAEVLPWRRTKQLSGVPSWCVGVLGWRGESVVVVDFEAMLDPTRQPASQRAMLIMKKTHAWDGTAFYALATTALPRLLHLTEDEISQRESDVHAGVSMMASVGTEDACIPNLKYLEEQVRQIL